MNAEPLVTTHRLSKHFPIVRGILIQRPVGYVRAVDEVDLTIYRGETLALVGESGSGKTTMGKLLIRVLRPTSGEIWFDGQEISQLDEDELRPIRRRMQMVYQDPTSSLNPRRRIKDILAEPLIIHGMKDGAARARRVAELLQLVELPEDFAYRYPGALSGGQKQRVGIARALALNPNFIVLDEPTSALDVSVQAKIIALLKRLQADLGLTYLFITHDLRVVRNLATRVAVMYLGKVVEQASVEALFANPQHPYTRALLSTIPALDEEELRVLPEKSPLRGEIPSAAHVPPGCPFHPRCPARFEPCDRELPEERETESGHLVRCHLYEPQPVEAYRP
ncbi:MAG: dipeptide ABC transporter ATP-binding protein [Anaerolineae bacterium]